MELTYQASPQKRQKLTTQRIMMHLTFALTIVYLFALYRSYQLGMAYLINALVLMATALITALVTESLFALATHQKVFNYLKHSYPWITAMILVLTVSVNMQPYAIAVATFIGIFFGKLVFGGFGQNIFNPAAVSRAVIFAAFAGSLSVDLVTSATPATTLQSFGRILNPEDFAIFLNDFGGLGNLALGFYQGALGETSALLIIILGIYLSIVKVIDYRIPLTYLLTLFLGGLLIGLQHNLGFDYALYAILTGGALFGAVFMLTDPVTAPNTSMGKVVYAAFAALMTMILRFYSRMPEGVVFSILFANMIAPLINRFFYGKQIDRLALKQMLTLGFVALCILLGYVGGIFLKPTTYRSINIPQFDHGPNVLINDDYLPYAPELISQDGDTYHVSVLGYGLLDKAYGGSSGISETEDVYARNEFTITLDSEHQKVLSVTWDKFGDTTNIGDKANNEGFLYQFEGIDMEGSVDVVSKATYSSKSAIAAVNYVLRGCPTTYAINDDYAIFEAEVISIDDHQYHVTVLGYGLLQSEYGGSGGISHTDDIYARNEYDIKVNKGKVVEIVMTKFGDTTYVGDKVDAAYLNDLKGKTLDDSVEAVSGATFTSRSALAAIQAALTADEK